MGKPYTNARDSWTGMLRILTILEILRILRILEILRILMIPRIPKILIGFQIFPKYHHLY